MFCFRLFILTLFLAMSLSARPAAACYTSVEAEAEQGLRIHSELMVIGLTCIKMSGGPGLYAGYQNFTQKNAGLISEYEENLIRYYSSNGASNPEQKLHTLRTDLANEISRRAVSMSPVTFCHRYASRIDKALAMNTQTVRRWAQRSWPNQPVSEPLCRI